VSGKAGIGSIAPGVAQRERTANGYLGTKSDRDLR
jgi:hypothetical protein